MSAEARRISLRAQVLTGEGWWVLILHGLGKVTLNVVLVGEV